MNSHTTAETNTYSTINRFIRSMAFALIAAVALLPLGAQAASQLWDTNGSANGAGTGTALSNIWGGDYWTTATTGNRATGAWADSNDAIFSAGTDAATKTYTIDVGALRKVRNLTHEDGASVTLGTSGSLQLSADATWTAANSTGTRTLTVAVPVDLNGKTLGITISKYTCPIEISGGITGSTTITLNGGGTLILSGNNSGYDGSVQLGGHILKLGGSTSYTFAGDILVGDTVTSNVEKIGSGTLTFTGQFADAFYAGVFTMKEGTLLLNHDHSTGGYAINVGGGDGTTDFNLLGGTVKMLANDQFDPNILLRSDSGIIQGTFDLNGTTQYIKVWEDASGIIDTAVTKGILYISEGLSAKGEVSAALGGDSGVGQQYLPLAGLSLTGLNTYSGITTFLANDDGSKTAKSTINTWADAGVAQATGTNPNIYLGGGAGTLAILCYTGGTASGNKNLNFSGAPSMEIEVVEAGTVMTIGGSVTGSSGDLSKSGAGTLALTGPVTSYTGNTYVLGGTLKIGANDTLGVGSTTLSEGAALDVNGQNFLTSRFNLTGSTTLRNSAAGAATLDGFNLTLVNAGNDLTTTPTVTLSGGPGATAVATIASTAASVTFVSGGTDFMVGDELYLTPDGVSGVAIRVTAVDGVTGAITAYNTYDFGDISDANMTGWYLDQVNGQQMGEGSGANFTYHPSNLTIARLKVNSLAAGWSTAPTVSLINGGNASVSAAQTLAIAASSTLTVDATGDLTIPWAVTGADGDSALTKIGNGKLTLTGANTYSGATTVSGGKLLVNGSLANSDITVAAATLGGSGTVKSAAIGASGTYQVTILAPGGTDKLTTTGNLTLTGSPALSIVGTLDSSKAPYTVATYTGTLTGTFAAPSLDFGWSISYGDGSNDAITLQYSGGGTPAGAVYKIK